MRKPSETWVPHPYTCRPHFSFFLHQKHKFGPLKPSRSTNTRHIEIGPNFMLLGPHLYKILPWAALQFSILDLALGLRNMRYFHFKFHFRKVIFLASFAGRHFALQNVNSQNIHFENFILLLVFNYSII